jgi:hypothetical protein
LVLQIGGGNFTPYTEGKRMLVSDCFPKKDLPQIRVGSVLKFNARLYQIAVIGHDIDSCCRQLKFVGVGHCEYFSADNILLLSYDEAAKPLTKKRVLHLCGGQYVFDRTEYVGHLDSSMIRK